MQRHPVNGVLTPWEHGVARPVIWGGLAVVALLTLATPALGLRIGQPPIDAPYDLPVVSRIREHWTRGSSPREATVGGIASSAGVVTSAALIMVAIFSIFLTLPLIELKVLGIGMGAAVLIDATVVRGVLLPAALSLAGDRAWRLRRHGDHGSVGV